MKIPTIKAYKYLSKELFQSTKELSSQIISKPRKSAITKRLKARGFQFKHKNTKGWLTKVGGIADRFHATRYNKQEKFRKSAITKRLRGF
jgi:hypothetical protein